MKAIRLSVWFVFVLYCLLASVAWVVTPFGERTSFFEQQIILFTVAGAGAIAFTKGKFKTTKEKLPLARLAIAGMSFWGVPICLIHWAASHVAPIVISTTFALLPVVVVLVVTSVEDMQGKEGWGSLVPALIAFGGVLLLFPVGLPESGKGQLMVGVVLVAVVLMAVSGVCMHLLIREVALEDAIVVVCFANATLLAICGFVTAGFTGGWTKTVSLSSGIDLTEMILVFWLLREMPPVRFATRALLIPLLTAIEGYVVLRPAITGRMTMGATLMAGGALWILFSKTTDDEAILSFR